MRGRLYSGDIRMGPRDRKPTSLVQQSLSVSCALLSPQGLRRAVLCHQHTDLGPNSDGCRNGGSFCLVLYSDTIGEGQVSLFWDRGEQTAQQTRREQNSGSGLQGTSTDLNMQGAELRLRAPERQH